MKNVTGDMNLYKHETHDGDKINVEYEIIDHDLNTINVVMKKCNRKDAIKFLTKHGYTAHEANEMLDGI